VQLVKRNQSCGAAYARARGFTLLEVMIAVFVTAIGLLGIAKLQALAYASTGSANIRSLVAIQAAGLAASMHANRNYWANGSAPASFTITVNTTGTTIISDATLNGAATAADACWFGGGSAPCNPANLAAFDLHTWAKALNGMLANSNPVTTIACMGVAPTNCTITVTWNEKAVAINSQAAAGTTAATFAAPYILYVEP
jgi:type IV pilus assembly protein PilV